MSISMQNEIILFDLELDKLDHFKGNNNKIEDTHRYYDCGAHFSFKEICKILENVVMDLPADRRGVSMYEDDVINSNTDSKKKLKVDYEQVCRFVEHYDSNSARNNNHIITCLFNNNQMENDQKNQQIKPKEHETNLMKVKVPPVTLDNPPNLMFYRKINPTKNTKNEPQSIKKANKLCLSKKISDKGEKTTLFLGNVSDPKKNTKINLSKVMIKNVEKNKVNMDYTSPIRNNVSVADRYKNPVTSFEIANVSVEKNFKKLNFSRPKVLIEFKPVSNNNRKIISSLIENSINNTVYCKTKSRNIKKILTLKTNENSKTVENKTFLTNNNTKDTFPSSNKLLSSNITLPYDKKPSKEKKKFQFEKSKDEGKSQSKCINSTFEKTLEKVNLKNLKETDIVNSKFKIKKPISNFNCSLKNFSRQKKSVKNKNV